MRRVARKTLLFSATLTLLMAAACTAMWIRSFHENDRLEFFSEDKWQYWITSHAGKLEWYESASPDADWVVKQRRIRYIEVRYSTLLAILIILPTVQGIMSLARMRRTFIARRRVEQGLCVNCGYDLRGGQEVCPECGIPKKPPAPSRPSDLNSHD